MRQARETTRKRLIREVLGGFGETPICLEEIALARSVERKGVFPVLGAKRHDDDLLPKELQPLGPFLPAGAVTGPAPAQNLLR
jgi:hypothetical protein